MSTGRNLPRSVISALILVGLGAPAFGQTAAEKLGKAADLFKAGDYDQSKALLLEIEPSQLNADQNRQRSELVEEVVVAINQSNKARRDLQDAEQALESNDRVRAGDLFRAVQGNNYATADQKVRAKNGLATISRQQELESKLPAPTSQPAAKPAKPAASKGKARKAG